MDPETGEERRTDSTTPSGDAQPLPPLTASERSEILRQHHPEIRNMLDLEQIFPFLNQYRLLTDSEQEELASVIYSRNHKITQLVGWLPRKGSDSLHRFIACLRSSTDGTAHGELANLLQSAAEQAITARRQHTQGQRPLSTRRLAVALIIISTIAFALWFYHYHPLVRYHLNLYCSPCLPYPPEGFVGRESEMLEVVQLLDFGNTKNRLISIVGPPGFGKSTLAIHLGHEMVANGITVYYVDMVEVSSSQALAEKVLDCDVGIVSIKNVTVDRLHKWARGLSYQTLLILDNCDDMLHKEKDNLQKAVKKMLESSPKLKILMTSRQRTMLVSQFQLYQLHTLTFDASCELLQNVVERLNSTLCHSIANLTGNVPLALKVVGALLTQPDAPSPMVIVSNLRKQLISTLSPQELPLDERVNASIGLSYQYLSQRLQKIGRYLANFPGSFDEHSAHSVLLVVAKKPPPESFKASMLREFVQRSLLEYHYRTNRYQFHRLIREFFLDVQKSIGDSGWNETRRFSNGFQWHYVAMLESLIVQFTSDHKATLATLDIERHNIQQLLREIENVNVASMMMFTVALKRLNDAITIRFLPCRFTDEELFWPVQSAVSFLDNNWKSLPHIAMDIVFDLYVNLVVNLGELEENINGTSSAVQIFLEKKPVIEEMRLYDPTGKATASSYSVFYSWLSEYLFLLNRHDGVRES